ncbi:hypothetical protein CBOM_07858 [Ceraceosorus bombacis]|uniref:Uncharacterized protein n=1 Tax=Ceraceosorus bombacis TaxID=401625 RepID=A0A0P1B9R4_9BASI|nr:hypothetical protein CBOM_07858 [Ceraceosorus bombacis]
MQRYGLPNLRFLATTIIGKDLDRMPTLLNCAQTIALYPHSPHCPAKSVWNNRLVAQSRCSLLASRS